MTLKLSTTVDKLNDRLKFCQSSNPPTFSTSELEKAITNTIEHYGVYKRYQVLENLTLIADQAEYSWPATAINVAPVLFSDSEMSQVIYSGIPSIPEAFSEYLTHYIESPALVNRSQTFFSLLYESLLGEISVDEPRRKIIISPTPKEAKTVKLPVFKAHPMTGTGESREYQTILDEHVDYLIDYAEAQCLKSLAKAYAVNNKKVGDRDIRGVATAEQLLKITEDLEERFYAKFYAPVAARN